MGADLTSSAVQPSGQGRRSQPTVMVAPPGAAVGTQGSRRTLRREINVRGTDPGRRRLLAGLLAAPAAGAAAVATTRLGAHAATLRPGGAGTSAQRCGSCGAHDHAMLDATCPARPPVMRV